jgi:hypothetical protein
MGMDDWHYKWTEQFGYHLDADVFIKFFAQYLEPQRIFSEETLATWAKDNGWLPPESIESTSDKDKQ